MVTEIRQRLLFMKSSGGTDPSLADDDAIKRRINARYLYWAAQGPDLGGIPGLSGTYSWTMATGDFSEPVPADMLTPWQVYQKSATSGLYPVDIIAPRDEGQFQAQRRDAPVVDSNGPGIQVYFLNNEIVFVGAEDNLVTVVGDYVLKYFQQPTELLLDADETVWPAQLDEILVSDVVAQVQSDGGKLELFGQLQSIVASMWSDFRKQLQPRQRIRQPRMRDAMGFKDWSGLGSSGTGGFV